MKIVCATNMPYAIEAFGTLGDAVVIEGRSIEAGDVKDADILAIRSTTRVSRELLEGSRVRFVGTATIGIDHMDTKYFDQAGIRWCYAPGCNANSVSEYVVAALLCLCRRHRSTLAGKTIGVIGVGNVGRRVVQKAEALGLRVLQNDPPRQEREPENRAFVDLDTVLREADVLTFHVPLTADGPHRTRRMANRDFFSKLKPGCILFNAARGPVVESDALLQAMSEGIVRHAVIDTWEGEPAYRTDVLDRADLGTPHIAGHSFEGKVNGTVMVYREACRFLGVEPRWSPEKLLPPPLVPRVTAAARDRGHEDVLWEVVRQVYDIEADDARLRSAATDDATLRARRFDQLRKDYPMRREFNFTKVILEHAEPGLRNRIAMLGFAS